MHLPAFGFTFTSERAMYSRPICIHWHPTFQLNTCLSIKFWLQTFPFVYQLIIKQDSISSWVFIMDSILSLVPNSWDERNLRMDFIKYWYHLHSYFNVCGWALFLHPSMYFVWYFNLIPFSEFAVSQSFSLTWQWMHKMLHTSTCHFLLHRIINSIKVYVSKDLYYDGSFWKSYLSLNSDIFVARIRNISFGY